MFQIVIHFVKRPSTCCDLMSTVHASQYLMMLICLLFIIVEHIFLLCPNLDGITLTVGQCRAFLHFAMDHFALTAMKQIPPVRC